MDKPSLINELRTLDVSVKSIYRDLIGISRTENYSAPYKHSSIDVASLFNQGNEEFRFQNYDRSLVFYNKCISIDPSYLGVYFARGNVYVELKDYERSIEDFDTVIDGVPRTELEFDGAANDLLLGASLVNRANAKVCVRDFECAISDYCHALELLSGFDSIHYNLGIAYFLKGLYSDSADSFEAARSTSRSKTISNLALCKLVEGNLVEAERFYKQVIQDGDPNARYTIDPIKAVISLVNCSSLERDEIEREQIDGKLHVKFIRSSYEGETVKFRFKGLVGMYGNMGVLGTHSGSGYGGGSAVLITVIGTDEL